MEEDQATMLEFAEAMRIKMDRNVAALEKLAETDPEAAEILRFNRTGEVRPPDEG